MCLPCGLYLCLLFGFLFPRSNPVVEQQLSVAFVRFRKIQTFLTSGLIKNINFSLPNQKFHSLHVASGHLYLFALPLIRITGSTVSFFPFPFTQSTPAMLLLCVGSSNSGKQRSRAPATRALPRAASVFRDPLHNSSCRAPEILTSDIALALARRHVSHTPIYIRVTCNGETPLLPICPRSFGERCQVIDVITPSLWLKARERGRAGEWGEGGKDVISLVGRGGKGFHTLD